MGLKKVMILTAINLKVYISILTFPSVLQKKDILYYLHNQIIQDMK